MNISASWFAFASHPVLADQANWGKFPDSVEALYQLSFLYIDVLESLLKRGSVSKKMTLVEATELRNDIAPPTYFKRDRKIRWSPMIEDYHVSKAVPGYRGIRAGTPLLRALLYR